jgi:hypothetical protein
LEQAQKLVQAQVAECQQWLNGLLTQRVASFESKLYEAWVIQFRIMNITAMINWLEEINGSLTQA